MSDEVIIKTKYCNPNMSFGSPDGCDEVILKLPKTEVMKLQPSVVSDNPALGKFDMNILGAGLGLVLIFYVLGYGLGRIIKMVNL